MLPLEVVGVPTIWGLSGPKNVGRIFVDTIPKFGLPTNLSSKVV